MGCVTRQPAFRKKILKSFRQDEIVISIGFNGHGCDFLQIMGRMACSHYVVHGLRQRLAWFELIVRPKPSANVGRNINVGQDGFWS